MRHAVGPPWTSDRPDTQDGDILAYSGIRVRNPRHLAVEKRRLRLHGHRYRLKCTFTKVKYVCLFINICIFIIVLHSTLGSLLG
jgi:hypothetical protein